MLRYKQQLVFSECVQVICLSHIDSFVSQVWCSIRTERSLHSLYGVFEKTTSTAAAVGSFVLMHLHGFVCVTVVEYS